jgi:hypothetical protein
VTAVNLIEEISSVSFPYLLLKPFLLVAFQKEDGDPEETEASLVFTVDEVEIGRASFLVDFSGHPRARSILELNALIIPKPGRLQMCVHMGETRFGDWDIFVKETTEEQEGSNQIASATASRAKRSSSRRTTARRTAKK